MNRAIKMEIRILRLLLGIYILFCLIIAGLNFGVAPNASEETAEMIRYIWNFYENQFKTLLILAGSILSYRVIGKNAKMQRRNYLLFILSAIVVHIFGPFFSGNKDLYFFAMPMPWSTTAIQTAVEDSTFYIEHLPLWGAAGISASLGFYLVISIVVYLGTVLYGRRWQCSSLCLFNGFVSETFAPAFPFFKNRKGRIIPLFSHLRRGLLILSIIFSLYWLAVLITGSNNLQVSDWLSGIEVYKYLSIELIMAMFLWIAFTGRGYCYYCPLGTVLAGVSRLAGQKIRSDLTRCIKCGKCDKTCPMGIEIQKQAMQQSDIKSNLCVGCGHCVDVCPANTLEYSTTFLDRLRRK